MEMGNLTRIFCQGSSHQSQSSFVVFGSFVGKRRGEKKTHNKIAFNLQNQHLTFTGTRQPVSPTVVR